MKICVASLLTLLSLFFCRSVSAEKAVVFVPDADGSISADLIEMTPWLIADWFKERGVERLMPQEAAPDLFMDLRRCHTVDCASRYLGSSKGIDYAVVSKFIRSGEGDDLRIEVILVNREGEQYSQDWPVGNAVESALDAALTHAYTAFLGAESKRNAHNRTKGVELNATTIPEPYARDDRNAADPYRDKSEPRISVWNYLIGGGLLAGSVPLLLAPIYVAARDYDCKEEDESNRCVRYHFGEISIVELSLGAASLLAGAFFILFEPITVEGELSVGDGRGVIRLRGAF